MKRSLVLVPIILLVIINACETFVPAKFNGDIPDSSSDAATQTATNMQPPLPATPTPDAQTI